MFKYVDINLLVCFLINIYIVNSQVQNYDYYNINQNASYAVIDIPIGSNYYSNDSCVTYSDLVNYGYSDYWGNWNNRIKVFPENYCYGMLSYNITREDFFNITNKNRRK
jgi:hypothetical protein